MPLTVAQLNITVQADTTAAMQALQQLNQQFAQLAQVAVAGATEEAQGQQQVIQAMSGVSEAAGAFTATIQGSAQAVTAAADQEAAANQQVAASMAGMGSVGSSALMGINQAMLASGQSIGPLNMGIMLIATNLRLIPPAASTAQTALTAVGLALTAIGVASAAFAAPAQQGLQQLQNAVEQVGSSLSDYTGKVNEAVNRGAVLGRTQGDVYQALTVLVRGTQNVDQAMQYLNVTEDLAAAKNISLADAARTVIRVYEGYGRSLKEFGINMTFTHNAQAGLDAANRTLVNSTDQVTAAQQRLGDALQRQADREAQAALGADQVAQAQQRLNDATQSYVELQQRLAAEDMVPKVTETARALESLAQAQQRVTDLQRQWAAEDLVPKQSHQAEAWKAIAAAQQNLMDVQARIHEATTLTVQDHDAAANAADRVAEAQERLALATGGGILQAQNALRAAISQQRAELDRLHAKEQESISQKQELARAERDLAAARAAAPAAAEKDRAEALIKELDRTKQMRDATQAVTKAVQDLAAARQKDAADALLLQITRSNELRAAQNQIRDAVEAVAQAYRNAQKAAIGLSAGGISVTEAERSLAHAKRIQEEAIARVRDARLKLQAQQDQGARAIGQLAQRVAGAADASSRGWSGAMNRIKAELQNLLANFGNAGGRFLTLAFPFIIVGEKLGSILSGGAAGADVASGGALAEGMGATGEAAGVAAAPVAIIAGAIAVAGAAFYEAYQHITPFRHAIDDTGRALAGVFGSTIQRVSGFIKDHKQEWHDLAGEISKAWNIIKPVLDVFTHMIGITLTHAFTFLGDVVKTAVDFISGFIKTNLDIIIGIISVFLDLITGNWGKAWDDIKKTVGKVFDDIKTLIGNVAADLWKAMWNLGVVMIGGLAYGFELAWHYVADFFKKLPNRIWDVLKWVWNTGGTLVVAGINFIIGLVNGMGSEIGHSLWNFFTKTLPDAIWNAVQWLWQKGGDMYTAGINLVIGFWNGIVSKAKWLTDMLHNFGKTVIHDITHPWEMLSPSKVMANAGQMLVEGLALGINANSNKAATAVKSMNNAMMKELVPSSAGFNVGVGGFGGVGAARPGVTLVALHVTVQGSVWTTKDLADALRDEFTRRNLASGGTFFTATR